MSALGQQNRERWISRAFKISLVLKGVDGLLELIGGLLLLVVPVSQINIVVQVLTQHELKQDSTDFIATHLRQLASTLTGSETLFAALYLLVHGVVKVVLVAAVLRGRIVAYPWMIGFLAAFAAYQIYEMTLKFSLGLLLLTVFDGVIIWLTVHEYRRSRSAPH